MRCTIQSDYRPYYTISQPKKKIKDAIKSKSEIYDVPKYLHN